jgi:hypothetical protein
LGKKVIAGVLIVGGLYWLVEMDGAGQIVRATSSAVNQIFSDPFSIPCRNTALLGELTPQELRDRFVVNFDGLSYTGYRILYEELFANDDDTFEHNLLVERLENNSFTGDFQEISIQFHDVDVEIVEHS